MLQRCGLQLQKASTVSQKKYVQSKRRRRVFKIPVNLSHPDKSTDSDIKLSSESSRVSRMSATIHTDRGSSSMSAGIKQLLRSHVKS